jgi:hypothetical protein
MMIEVVSEIEFLKDQKITDLKPQFPIAPIISRDVPFASAPPRSTRFGIATPPLARSSSSSSRGVLQVLKSMLAWCCDTRQRQEMRISNQRRLADRMGVNEFDEFPLLIPPLDDHPFASLSTTDWVAMEADDDDAEGGFGSE